MKSTTLYFSEGSSDKIYQVAIEPRQGGWVVNFAFWRRGSTLSTGTKTSTPVPEAEAIRIYEKLVRSKTAKGYQSGEDGTSYSVGSQKLTDVRPQLLNPVDEAGLERLITSNAFVLEQKFDGRRLLLRKTGKSVVGINRRGFECGVPESILWAAGGLLGDFLVDGEAVGDVYHVFDLLEINHEDWRPQPYRERIIRLSHLMPGEKKDALRWVSREYWKDPKRIRLRQLRDEGAEGVVFKRLSAPYKPGRPNSGGDQLKYKFVETASVVVPGINACRSVAIAVWNKNTLVPAGNVTIPADHPVPRAGSVVEVRYLYALRASGALYQPVYRGERDDINSAECTRSQLKFRNISAGSRALKRVLSDFGAEHAFAQAAARVKEHYGIELSVSAVREATLETAARAQRKLEAKYAETYRMLSAAHALTVAPGSG
jgi:bifunctional non-homologous end joining protein LigD